VMTVSVCLSVRERISGTTRPIKNSCMLSMSVARSSSGGVAISYVQYFRFTDDVIFEHNEPYAGVSM